MTSHDMAEKADAAKQACTDKLRQRGIELEIWSREELWQELARTPALAATLVRDPERYERLCGGYYTHLKRAKLALAEAEAHQSISSPSKRDQKARSIQPPTLHKTERSLTWTNGIVTLDAYLPVAGRTGYLAIKLDTPEHVGVTTTMTHEQILEVLWPGHNTGYLWTHRRFTQIAPSDTTIFLPNAALHTDQQTLTGFADGVDAIIPAYLDALRKLEEAWEAQGMRFLHGGGGGAEVVLCSLPWWLWRDIVDFTRAHDFEAGHGPWFMFDPGNTLLRPYHRCDTEEFDAGYHAVLWVRSGELSGGLGAPQDVMLDLVWAADSASFDNQSCSPRGSWTAGYAAEWVITSLIPEVMRWHRRKPPRRSLIERLFALWERPDEDVNTPVRDHRREATVGLVEHPSTQELRRTVQRMQVSAHTLGSPEPFVINPADYQALLDQMALVATTARRPHLHYAASKLDMSRKTVADAAQFGRELIERSRTWGDRQVNGITLDMTLCALISLLADTRPVLSDDTRHKLAEALRPIAAPPRRDALGSASPYADGIGREFVVSLS